MRSYLDLALALEVRFSASLQVQYCHFLLLGAEPVRMLGSASVLGVKRGSTDVK